MPAKWLAKLKRLRKAEKAFCAFLLLYFSLKVIAPDSGFTLFAAVVSIALGTWVGFAVTIRATRKAIWRLRNRLMMTYLFIAVVPVLLIVLLAVIGGYALISQLAVYLAVSNLDRRATALRDITETLAQSESRLQPEILRSVVEIHRGRYPGLRVVARKGVKLQAWPPGDPEVSPHRGWGSAHGVLVRDGRYFLWSHAVSDGDAVTVTMPLSRSYLSNMVPGLGDVSLHEEGKEKASPSGRERSPRPLPPPYNQFDVDVNWFSTVHAWRWESPGETSRTVLYVHTRPSAVLNTIFSAKIEQVADLLPTALLVVSILFLIVELVALVVGVSLASTITRAVHSLYQGTQRVMEGDFTHRIHVRGRDQLAELGSSFNTMTANLERLLAVAKEKERMEAELEIARQVQAQLYPKVTPVLRTLKLTAICRPARMVSGDYYDYLGLPDGRLALAIGDVAGKGISAALLMATIQAAIRMDLRGCRAIAAPGEPTEMIHLPTSRLVSDLNKQLHATTSAEKYATFFFALYNENNAELRYTNAGHLPPVLMRNGEAIPLEVSGTVVGAFPFARYEENMIKMETGDLLVCYTDGITEPENEYGEEFGEARLIDLIAKNLERDDEFIASEIMDAVTHWTNAKEQPDDMTLLLARKM